MFEQCMQQRGLRRRLVLDLSHCMSLLPVLALAELIATVPRDLADVCLRYTGLEIAETPIESPVTAVHQSWHERFHQEHANVWLRSRVLAGLQGRPRRAQAGVRGLRQR